MTDYIQITKVDCLFHGCFVCLQVKLRGVLNSLIDSEANYLKSLERLTNVSTKRFQMLLGQNVLSGLCSVIIRLIIKQIFLAIYGIKTYVV